MPCEASVGRSSFSGVFPAPECENAPKHDPGPEEAHVVDYIGKCLFARGVTLRAKRDPSNILNVFTLSVFCELHPRGQCSERFHTYPSLSAIALAITGTSWNGPRFFGLRGKSGTAPPVDPISIIKDAPRASTRSAVRSMGPLARDSATNSAAVRL